MQFSWQIRHLTPFEEFKDKSSQCPKNSRYPKYIIKTKGTGYSIYKQIYQLVIFLN